METTKKLPPERISELNAFLIEFQNESDRGAALLGAAMVDDCLGRIISDYLVDKKKVVDELLENANAPLSTFSARAKIVYCLGLISDCEYFNIEIIRFVRNKFAHKLHGLSFNDQEIIKICRKLKYDKSGVGIIKLPTARHSFTLATAILVHDLNMASAEHRKSKNENNGWEPFPSLKW